jgi:hemerythrin-like domain-containing protein
MRATDNLRRQHGTILAINRELLALLDTSSLGADGKAARSKIASLAGVLNVHLAMEDGVMYPRLMESTDPTVRETATIFVKQMGGLRSGFQSYVKRWMTPENIQAEPAEFVAQTRRIVEALAGRIQHEDEQLYPLVDSVSLSAPPPPR